MGTEQTFARLSSPRYPVMRQKCLDMCVDMCVDMRVGVLRHQLTSSRRNGSNEYRPVYPAATGPPEKLKEDPGKKSVLARFSS